MRAVLDVKGLAERNGLKKPYQLARYLGVTDVQAGRLWRAETQSSISLKTIAMLCERFNCTPDSFIKLIRDKASRKP